MYDIGKDNIVCTVSLSINKMRSSRFCSVYQVMISKQIVSFEHARPEMQTSQQLTNVI